MTFCSSAGASGAFVVADLQGGYEIIDPMMVTSLSMSEATAESGG